MPIRFTDIAPPKKKGGRPRIEDRDKTNEALKPWIAAGMSRATWYQRQREKRLSKNSLD